MTTTETGGRCGHPSDGQTDRQTPSHLLIACLHLRTQVRMQTAKAAQAEKSIRKHQVATVGP